MRRPPWQPNDFSQRSGKFQFMASPFVFATHRQISRVNRLLATLPKTHPCKSFVCHTCDTPGGACALSGNLGELCVSALSFPQRHSFNAERLTRGHPPLFPPNLEAAFLPVPSANCWP